MIAALGVVSSGDDPDDLRSMAWISFLIVAALPSTTFVERFRDPTPRSRRP
jgi:hypothetical protein